MSSVCRHRVQRLVMFGSCRYTVSFWKRVLWKSRNTSLVFTHESSLRPSHCFLLVCLLSHIFLISHHSHHFIHLLLHLADTVSSLACRWSSAHFLFAHWCYTSTIMWPDHELLSPSFTLIRWWFMSGREFSLYWVVVDTVNVQYYTGRRGKVQLRVCVNIWNMQYVICESIIYGHELNVWNMCICI